MNAKQNAWADRPHNKEAHAKIKLHYRELTVCGLCGEQWPCAGAKEQIEIALRITHNSWYFPISEEE